MAKNPIYELMSIGIDFGKVVFHFLGLGWSTAETKCHCASQVDLRLQPDRFWKDKKFRMTPPEIKTICKSEA